MQVKDKAMLMSLGDLFGLAAWVAIIEFIGGLFIVLYVLAAIVTLFHSRNLVQARLLAADGAIIGLSFKLAGTLLKTIELQTWEQILMFVAIFVLRTVLKRIFNWERERLLRVQTIPQTAPHAPSEIPPTPSSNSS